MELCNYVVIFGEKLCHTYTLQLQWWQQRQYSSTFFLLIYCSSFHILFPIASHDFFGVLRYFVLLPFFVLAFNAKEYATLFGNIIKQNRNVIMTESMSV